MLRDRLPGTFLVRINRKKLSHILCYKYVLSSGGMNDYESGSVDQVTVIYIICLSHSYLMESMY